MSRNPGKQKTQAVGFSSRKAQELFDEGIHADEGSITTFQSGATRADEPVERFDLVSPEAVRRRALTYGQGALRYGERNWEKGLPISNCLNHAIQHLNLYLSGDTSEDHLAHASVNLDFVMHYERHNPDSQDVPRRKG